MPAQDPESQFYEEPEPENRIVHRSDYKSWSVLMLHWAGLPAQKRRPPGRIGFLVVLTLRASI